MKRIIACIVACISLFFGVACKDKREKVEYEEGHIFLTEENFKIAIDELVDYFGYERDQLAVADKEKISKQAYRYYADMFDMGYEKLFLSRVDGRYTILAGEYRDEATAEYYKKQMDPKDEAMFRYRNIVGLELYPVYLMLDVFYDYVYYDDCRYLTTKDEKKLLVYESFEEVATVQLPDRVEYTVGLSLVFLDSKELICNKFLQKIGFFSAIFNSDLETVILNDGLKIIGYNAFYGCENFEYTVIPLSVEKIGEQAFSHGNIFCEAEAKPNGWADDFYCEQAKVYWKGEWAYDENGKPVPLVQEEPPQEDGVAA